MLAYFNFPTWLRPEIIPGLPLRWYGLMYLLAFATAYLLFMYQVRKEKLDYSEDDISNFFFWVILGLLIGGRLFAVLIFDPTGFYWRNPWLIFWPFRNGQFTGLAGMNFYGGVVGGIVAAAVYARRKNIDLIKWGDMLAVSIPLGYTWGRLGNFINGELFGRVTQAPWGIVFPHARPFSVNDPWAREFAAEIGMEITEGMSSINLPRHPTQLYEMFAEGILSWLIMWFVLRRMKTFRGFLLGAYVFLYGFFRFFIDYFRMPLRGGFALEFDALPNPTYILESPWNFIASQGWSLAMMGGAVVFMLLAKRFLQEPPKPRDAGSSKKK
jgi:phosphatidylglycerol:prolipoprotein diacylglycerol transferase